LTNTLNFFVSNKETKFYNIDTWNHLEEVDGPLGGSIPGVDVSSVFKKEFDDLELKTL
jgi:hypothetical protein